MCVFMSVCAFLSPRPGPTLTLASDTDVGASPLSLGVRSLACCRWGN